MVSFIMMPSLTEGKKTAIAGCSRPFECKSLSASRPRENRAVREGFEKPRPSSSLPLSSVRDLLQLFHVVSVIETSTKNQQFQRKEIKTEDSYHDTN